MTLDNSKLNNHQFSNEESRSNSDAFGNQLLKASLINTVKLIPTDIYPAETLTAIALTYIQSPQAISPATFEVLESLI